jgi:hypothetical protein
MAKIFDSIIHLPLAGAQHEQLKAAAKYRSIQANALARQFIQEGLQRVVDEMPKPEKRKEFNYPWHGTHLSKIDNLTTTSREDIDWCIDLGICEIDAQGICQQTEPYWTGKHAEQENPYDHFYDWGGRYIREDSPTMLEDRIRGTYDWEQARVNYRNHIAV